MEYVDPDSQKLIQSKMNLIDMAPTDGSILDSALLGGFESDYMLLIACLAPSQSDSIQLLKNVATLDEVEVVLNGKPKPKVKRKLNKTIQSERASYGHSQAGSG